MVTCGGGGCGGSGGGGGSGSGSGCGGVAQKAEFGRIIVSRFWAPEFGRPQTSRLGVSHSSSAICKPYISARLYILHLLYAHDTVFFF